MRVSARLLSTWESVRYSYWFVPSLMAVAALALSVLTVWLDRVLPDRVFDQLPWLYTGSADGARSLLSEIASSMITVAGVVFSITIVAMTLASSQFGPRLLRNFMSDRGNQIVLGTFISAFLFCLMVLREVHGSDDDAGRVAFIPQISLIVAMLMALGGLGVLIYFIHHTAASIQAPNVIARVSGELHEAIDKLYPDKAGRSRDQEPPVEHELPVGFESQSVPVCAERGGYVQRIEVEELIRKAAEHDLVLRIEHNPGRYVQPDDVIIRVWPETGADAAVRRELQATFTINTRRSLTQDAEFAIDQLVEIACRALSTGVNDPFTAIQCIDRLGQAMSHVAGRAIPSPYRADESGKLRVVAQPERFCQFMSGAFDLIRHNSRGSLQVTLRMLRAMTRVAPHVAHAEDAHCLREHASMVYEQALAAANTEFDRRLVESHHRQFLQSLAGNGSVSTGSRIADPGQE
jgi:uncharacterized membrane protein